MGRVTLFRLLETRTRASCGNYWVRTQVGRLSGQVDSWVSSDLDSIKFCRTSFLFLYSAQHSPLFPSHLFLVFFVFFSFFSFLFPFLHLLYCSHHLFCLHSLRSYPWSSWTTKNWELPSLIYTLSSSISLWRSFLNIPICFHPLFASIPLSTHSIFSCFFPRDSQVLAPKIWGGKSLPIL